MSPAGQDDRMDQLAHYQGRKEAKSNVPYVRQRYWRNTLRTFIVNLRLDISGWIEAEQLIRWKSQYPEWRMSESKKKGKKITGRKLPNFCGPNESKF